MLLTFWGNRLARIAKIAPVFYGGLSLPTALRAAQAALKIAPVFYGGLSLPTALRAAASGVKNCSRQFFMFTM
ncbi:hypothetical protein RD02_14840 [Pectobacterium brasiliense]|nr:hypothetical protein RD02_14840 [Pectobacterium brasiliense]